MATTIDQAFIKQYEAEVKLVFQREGGILRQCCRTKEVNGTTTTFQKVAKGTASTKARHGVITPMNQVHTPVEATLVDYYAADWVDKLDEAKINIDERMVIARSGAWALGRQADAQIITALGTTTQTAVSWTVTSAAAIRNALIGHVQALDALDVPNDGRRYGIMSSKEWAFAMCVTQFASADFIGASGLPYTEGSPIMRFKDFMGIKWCVHTGVSGAGTASAVPLTWHADSIGYATGMYAGNVASNGAISADITWHGDRQAHFIAHTMSAGAALIDDTGVIKGAVDDTAALPTS